MMVTEAIILAGGLGTRLRAAVPDLPKCMAPVAGKPFLTHVVDALRRMGIRRFVFSLGYKADVIEAYLAASYPTLDYVTVVEDEPLGTGGAIRLGLQACTQPHVLATNGDTLFRINLAAMEAVHREAGAACTLALKPMQRFDRYGTVTLDERGAVLSFREKQFYEEGLINGGLYIINRERFLQLPLPQKFSFEKDYLEAYTGREPVYGSVQDGYFIDIGIPADFEQAGKDLKAAQLDLGAIDGSWTLFLDRDGVINDERPGEYVLDWGQFRFSPGVLEAMPILSRKFGRILIVTNQRGVGKALMTEEGLQEIHRQMQQEMEAAGGRVDKIYYCTEKDNTCFFRKPNPGMAVTAIADFPGIDPKKAIMVGNKPSDMRFGRAAGLYTVFLATTNPQEPFPHPDVDLRFDSLLQFAQAVES